MLSYNDVSHFLLGDIVGFIFYYNTIKSYVGYYLYSVRAITLFWKLECKFFRRKWCQRHVRNFISAYLKYVSYSVKYGCPFSPLWSCLVIKHPIIYRFSAGKKLRQTLKGFMINNTSSLGIKDFTGLKYLCWYHHIIVYTACG